MVLKIYSTHLIWDIAYVLTCFLMKIKKQEIRACLVIIQDFIAIIAIMIPLSATVWIFLATSTTGSIL